MSQGSQASVIDQIPDPDAISAQLTRNLRENRLLRQLLRLARTAEKERSAKGVGNAKTRQQGTLA